MDRTSGRGRRSPRRERRCLMALMFFPRGGSSHVNRYMSRFLPAAGWDVTLVCGSLGPPGETSNAETFFPGTDVRPVDFSAASEAADPLAADVPLHPSFEDRPGAADRVFARLDDDAYERQVAAWSEQLRQAGAGEADVLHLNHLTPINEAARRTCPEVPVVGHLHGTELLMLREIDEGPPPGWEYAEVWAERMRNWARGCDRLLVLSTDAVRRVPDLLGVEAERVAWAPNGFDPDAFVRAPLRGKERIDLWRRWLVEDPQGWDESAEPGSVSYRDQDLAAFAGDAPVFVYVGRYTEVKRIPLLIRAHAHARGRLGASMPLVLLGGYPGEWEGEHPIEVVREVGGGEVFLAGWRGHDDLPAGLNASDVLVLPSVHEQFGQVIVEAGACGLPSIAVDAHGPATIVDAGENGWLVPPDDEQAMAGALVEAAADPGTRARMAEGAHRTALEHYSWPALVEQLAGVYEQVRSEHA